jgi:hypothetical protein
MKKYTLIFYLMLASFSTAVGQKDPNEVTSFYKVPLVCGAAPDLGCGSRAKPALLAMEKNKDIIEAWLNYSGTIYAIVWKEKDMTQKVARPIFKKSKIEFEAVNNLESQELRSTFRQDGMWFRGAEVDRLSMEEAGRIAESTTGFLLKKNEITQEEYSAIKPDIENYFKEELVKVRTLDELMKDSQETFVHAILEIYLKHVGKNRTNGLVEKYASYFGVNNDCCKGKKGDDSCPMQKL